MDQRIDETWRFSVRPGEADGVYLVVDSPVAPSKWIAMQPSDSNPGEWIVHADITPGTTRLRYYTVEDGAYLNCGSVGLQSEPASGLAASA